MRYLRQLFLAIVKVSQLKYSQIAFQISKQLTFNRWRLFTLTKRVLKKKQDRWIMNNHQGIMTLDFCKSELFRAKEELQDQQGNL